MRIMTTPKTLTIDGHDIAEHVLSATVLHKPGSMTVVEIEVYADAVRINGAPAAVVPPCKLRYCVRREPHKHGKEWTE